MKSAARTGEEGEASEAHGVASLDDVQNLRETVNQVTSSIQDRLDMFQAQFETQEQHTSALRATLDEFLRQFEMTRTIPVPRDSTEGSFPAPGAVPTQLGTEHVPVGIHPPLQPDPTVLAPRTDPYRVHHELLWVYNRLLPR